MSLYIFNTGRIHMQQQFQIVSGRFKIMWSAATGNIRGGHRCERPDYTIRTGRRHGQNRVLSHIQAIKSSQFTWPAARADAADRHRGLFLIFFLTSTSACTHLYPLPRSCSYVAVGHLRERTGLLGHKVFPVGHRQTQPADDIFVTWTLADPPGYADAEIINCFYLILNTRLTTVHELLPAWTVCICQYLSSTAIPNFFLSGLKKTKHVGHSMLTSGVKEMTSQLQGVETRLSEASLTGGQRTANGLKLRADWFVGNSGRCQDGDRHFHGVCVGLDRVLNVVVFKRYADDTTVEVIELSDWQAWMSASRSMFVINAAQNWPCKTNLDCIFGSCRGGRDGNKRTNTPTPHYL